MLFVSNLLMPEIGDVVHEGKSSWHQEDFGQGGLS